MQACNVLTRGNYPNMGVFNTTNNINRRVLRRYGQPARFAFSNRRNRRIRRSGMEINRAEGGFKNMLPTRKVKQIAINKYYNLVAHKVNNSYVYGVDSGSQQSFGYFLNLQTELAGAQEMIDYLKISDQYKVIGININTDIDRIPNAGDILPKLLMYYDTDMFTTAYPLTASNVMHLSISSNGNKNYNVLLNRNTIPKDYIGWIASSTAYNTKLKLHIGQANNCYLYGDPENDTRLGTIKVTFNVKFRLRDQNFDETKAGNMTIQQKIEKGIFVDEPRYKEVAVQTDEIEDKKVETNEISIGTNDCDSYCVDFFNVYAEVFRNTMELEADKDIAEIKVKEIAPLLNKITKEKAFEYLEKRDYSFRHISKQDFLDNFEFIKRKYLAQLHDFIDEGIFDLDDTMLNVHDKVQYNVALELKENKKWKRLLKKNKDK